MVQDIKIEDYTYPLPEDRIAKYPLGNRDDSKLLVYTNSTGRGPIAAGFREIGDYLPDSGLVVFNDTKVVPARLLFRKDTGAIVEIFCLEPYFPNDYVVNFAQQERCRWKAIIGNSKRWKGGKLSLFIGEDNPEADILRQMDLRAELVEKGDRNDNNIVEFTWKGGDAFSKVMEHCGRIPIPPYLKRETESIDLERYQTWYAKIEGSVAAPTAGLHFTQREIDAIDAKGLKRANLCLHVGAGTFLPVKSEKIGDHAMHSEPFVVTREFLETLRDAAGGHIMAVGTTSTRCLESLYFIGVHCIERGEPDVVEQWEPYREEGYKYSLKESLEATIKYMDARGLDSLTSRTRIIIVPGYTFRVIDFLATNFHQPESTLLLLISAFIGEDWRRVYDFALKNDFRFLSYGDSSLLEKV